MATVLTNENDGGGTEFKPWAAVCCCACCDVDCGWPLCSGRGGRGWGCWDCDCCWFNVEENGELFGATGMLGLDDDGLEFVDEDVAECIWCWGCINDDGDEAFVCGDTRWAWGPGGANGGWCWFDNE